MFKRLLPYLATIIVGVAITLLILNAKDVWHAQTTQIAMQILSDGFFVPGILLAGFGLIIFASAGGVFDMLGFSLYMLVNLFRRDINKRKYKDFYEYEQSKKDRKFNMGFMLWIGLAFILIALIFLILYLNL